MDNTTMAMMNGVLSSSSGSTTPTPLPPPPPLPESDVGDGVADPPEFPPLEFGEGVPDPPPPPLLFGDGVAFPPLFGDGVDDPLCGDLVGDGDTTGDDAVGLEVTGAPVVGADVGRSVGDLLGDFVGSAVVGDAVGGAVGELGDSVGTALGDVVGDADLKQVIVREFDTPEAVNVAEVLSPNARSCHPLLIAKYGVTHTFSALYELQTHEKE